MELLRDYVVEERAEIPAGIGSFQQQPQGSAAGGLVEEVVGRGPGLASAIALVAGAFVALGRPGDADAVRYLGYFTFVPIDEIAATLDQQPLAKVVVVPNFQHPRPVRDVHNGPLRDHPAIDSEVSCIPHITRDIQNALQMNAGQLNRNPGSKRLLTFRRRTES